MHYQPAAMLRRELNERALLVARAESSLHVVADGPTPSVLFGHDANGLHGNFHPAAYRRICADPAWLQRLNKVHTASRRMMLRSDWQWKELDCACSSDALLMNVFCHPATLRNPAVRGLLGIGENDAAVFGHKPRVPLLNGRGDQTEVDVKLGSLLIEAKLTETDFQIATPVKVARYRDFTEVFGQDIREWSMREPAMLRGYQAIRGILAAFATGSRFCLLCDGRRPDLIEIWYAVLRQVQSQEVRTRVMLLTWQELARVLSRPMQKYLDSRYGIAS